MKHKIITESGIFEILQQASYGELLIAGLLVIIIVIELIKFFWRIACREGWF